MVFGRGPFRGAGSGAKFVYGRRSGPSAPDGRPTLPMRESSAR